MTGLEPATSGVTGRRSNQLSYTPDDRKPANPPSAGSVYCTGNLRSSGFGDGPQPSISAGLMVGDDGIEPPTFSV